MRKDGAGLAMGDALVTTLVIADDHGILRAGLRSLLSRQPDLAVIGEAADGNQALQMTRNLEPDVLIADISMPGPSGIEIARLLQNDTLRTCVLILSMHEDPDLVQAALQAGARGYIAKRAVETDLIAAIRTLSIGETYVQRGLLPQELPKRAERGESLMPPMTLDDTDLAILRGMASGLPQAQVAAEAGLDPQTMAQRYADLARSLGLRGRVDLMRFATQHGIL